MKTGFTGTQMGMTGQQMRVVSALVSVMTELHHGCCIGADNTMHRLAMHRGVPIVLHPPTDTSKMANVRNASKCKLCRPRPYLTRNHNIVDACDMLLATPSGEEVLRSGTWATVRYARKRGKPVKIVYPDGSLTHENSPLMPPKRKVVVEVVGRHSKRSEGILVDTTSKSKTWSVGLSPFHLGPLKLYDGHVAQNVENAWQGSKVYPQHMDMEGKPNKAYFEWAQQLWADTWAHRYPMGKGALPNYSWWDGEELDYIQARKRIYLPLYAATVVKSDAYRELRDIARKEPVVLWDFDAYDRKTLGMNWWDVINDPTRKMGHGFVLAMLLEGYLKNGRASSILAASGAS